MDEDRGAAPQPAGPAGAAQVALFDRIADLSVLG
jgi:hypothetical protein